MYTRTHGCMNDAMADDRAFDNPYLEEKACTLSNEDQQKLQLGGDLERKLTETIVSTLPVLEEAYKDSSSQSVYTGSTGIALLHFHLATTLYKHSPEDSSKHLHHSLKLLLPTLSHLNTHRSTFLCGAAGPLSLATVVYSKLGDGSKSKLYLEQLIQLYTEQKPTFIQSASELLTGHIGYLYSLLFVNAYVPQTVDDWLLSEIASLILDNGEKGRQPAIASPLVYTWHNKHYLGAAHGHCGIFTVLLQVPVASLHPRITVLVRPSIDYLLSVVFPSGNLPSSLESSHSDRLIHWCHGAPGFVPLLAHAYKVFKDERYLKAAVQCGEVVWRRGLLRKGYGLCHGVAGNAYTFIHLYQLTGKTLYCHRAIKFIEWCLSSDQRACRTPDTPYSLFEGQAGPLYLYADVLAGMDGAKFPALEVPAPDEA